MIATLLMTVTVVGALFLGLLTLIRNPSGPRYRWLFVFIVCSSAWVATASLTGRFSDQIGLWLVRAAFVAACLFTYAMVRFVRAAALKETCFMLCLL